MKFRFLAVLAGLTSVLPAFADRSSELTTENVVVTATRFPDQYLDKPVNMTVITREQIENSGAKTVPDLLSRQSGFGIRDLFGNNASSTSVDLRGFGASADQNTLILVDGRRVSDIDLSGVQWSAIPVSAIERIEIVRGGGAVLYGEGAVAGVVNIITRAADRNRATLGATLGSFETREASADASYRSGVAAMSVSANKLWSNGYRANNANATGDVHANLRLRSDRGELDFKAGADNQKLRLPGARQVQPSAGRNELATDRRGTSTPLDYSTRDGAYFAAGLSRELDWGDVLAELAWREKVQKSYFDFGGFPDYRESDLSLLGFTPRVKIPFTALGRDSQLIVGADLYHWDYELLRSNSPQNISRPYNAVHAKQENAAAYLLASSRLRASTTLSAGWRQEQMNIDASDIYDAAAPGGAFGSGAPAGSHEESEYAWELGVREEFGAGLAASAKLGRSYRFATIDEIYEFSPTFSQEFQFLRPQIARTRELGLEQRLTGIAWRLAVFEMDLVDEIHLDPFSTGVGNTNLPPSRRRGVELEASWQIGERFSLSGAYTYTQAKFREGAFDSGVIIAGKSVPLVPRQRLNLAGTLDLGASSRFTLAGRYVGEQFMENDEANDSGVPIPAYTVIDARLSHRYKDWLFAATVNNLLSEKYFNYAVRSQFVTDRYNAYPLPERSVFLSAEYRFGEDR